MDPLLHTRRSNHQNRSTAETQNGSEHQQSQQRQSRNKPNGESRVSTSPPPPQRPTSISSKASDNAVISSASSSVVKHVVTVLGSPKTPEESNYLPSESSLGLVRQPSQRRTAVGITNNSSAVSSERTTSATAGAISNLNTTKSQLTGFESAANQAVNAMTKSIISTVSALKNNSLNGGQNNNNSNNSAAKTNETANGTSNNLSNNSPNNLPFPPMVFSFSPLSVVAKTLKVSNFTNGIYNSSKLNSSGSNTVNNSDKSRQGSDGITNSHFSNVGSSSVMADQKVPNQDANLRYTSNDGGYEAMAASKVDQLLLDYDHIECMADDDAVVDGGKLNLSAAAQGGLDSGSAYNSGECNVLANVTTRTDSEGTPASSLKSANSSDRPVVLPERFELQPVTDVAAATVSSIDDLASKQADASLLKAYYQTSLPSVIVTEEEEQAKQPPQIQRTKSERKFAKGLTKKEIAAIKTMGGKNSKRSKSDETVAIVTVPKRREKYAADNLGFERDLSDFGDDGPKEHPVGSTIITNGIELKPKDEETGSGAAKLSPSPPAGTLQASNVPSFLHGSSSQQTLPVSDPAKHLPSSGRSNSMPVLEKSPSTPSLNSTNSNESSDSLGPSFTAREQSVPQADLSSGDIPGQSTSPITANAAPITPTPVLTTAQAIASASITNAKGSKRRPSTLIQINNPSYKSRCEDFRTIFCEHGIPRSERLLADFSCAYYKSILIQGRVYITKHFIAFYANWVGLYEKWQIIKCADVRAVTKANTIYWIPNAIHITTVDGEKHIFASFAARDRAYEVISKVWNAVKSAPPVTATINNGSQQAVMVGLGGGSGVGPVAGPIGLGSCSSMTENGCYVNMAMDNVSTADDATILASSSSTVDSKVTMSIDNTTTSASSDNLPIICATAPPQQQHEQTTTATSSATTTPINDAPASVASNSADVNHNNNTTTATAVNVLTPELNTAISAVLQPASEVTYLNSTMTNSEMWNIVKEMYGKNLGLSRSEECEMQGIELDTIYSDDINGLLVEESEEALPHVQIEPPQPKSPKSLFRRSKSRSSVKSTLSSSSGSSLSSELAITEQQPQTNASEIATIIGTTIESSSDVTSIAVPTHSNNSIPAKCNCTDAHSGSVIVDRVFPMDVDKLYSVVFKGDKDKSVCFMERVHRHRQTHDLTKTNWTPLAESQQAELVKSCKDLGTYPSLSTLFPVDRVKTRSLEYTVVINHVMCKEAFTREKQYLLQHEPGRCFVVHSVARNEGPPYSDSFIFTSTWCVTSVPNQPSHSRILIHYKVTFIKSSFSLTMLKSTIEKGAKDGVLDFVECLLTKLERELHMINESGAFIENNNEAQDKENVEVAAVQDQSEQNSTTKSAEGDLADDEPQATAATAASHLESSVATASSTTQTHSIVSHCDMKLLRVILICLSVMIVVNMIMFARLYNLESKLDDMNRRMLERMNAAVQQSTGMSATSTAVDMAQSFIGALNSTTTKSEL